MNFVSIAGEETIEICPKDIKARRRSNTAPNAPIPLPLSELSAGVSIERLLSLPVPVLAYGGQVTIHGICPSGELPRVYGKKSALVRNGNGSLGVLYSAIDARKKNKIAEAVRICKGEFSVVWNGSLSVYKAVTSKDEVAGIRARLPEGVFGTACLMRCRISGAIYFVISVGAIRQAAIVPFVQFATGKPISEVCAKIKAEKRARIAERKKWEAESEERAKAYREQAEIWKAESAAKVVQMKAEAEAQGLRKVPSNWKLAPGKFLAIQPASDRGPAKKFHIEIAKRGPVLCVKTSEGFKKMPDYYPARMKERVESGNLFFM